MEGRGERGKRGEGESRGGGRTLQVGAEVGRRAVAAVPRHGPRAHLHQVRRPGLQPLDPRGAALGRHRVGDGLSLVLQRGEKGPLHTAYCTLHTEHPA